jgi:rhodanese-related sulfurtransferase
MIDVREYPEFAGGHVEGSEWVRLSELEKASEAWARTDALTLVCGTGVRAEQSRTLLAERGFVHLQVMAGGIAQWKREGGALRKLPGAVWSMERQVRVVAGSLVVVTLALGYFVWPGFMVLTGLIGAGLFFAGVSNTCMMATVLGALPWNRPARLAAKRV